MSELRQMSAEALLAAQHQQAALRAFAAPGPPGRGRIARRNADPDRDPSLVFRPSLRPAAVEQFDQRDPEQRLIVTGRHLEAALYVGERLAETAEQIEQLGAMGVQQSAHGGIAIERDRAIETCDRLREATLIPEHDAAAELGLREIGPDRERAG